MPVLQTFQESCLATLWRYAQSSHPTVQGAAFRALAAFSAQDFRVSHLPTQVYIYTLVSLLLTPLSAGWAASLSVYVYLSCQPVSVCVSC